MGAVALTAKDEEVLESLQKRLGLPSKSQVIHEALEKLREAVMRGQLASEIRKSVQKCGKADQEEHDLLNRNAFYRFRKK